MKGTINLFVVLTTTAMSAAFSKADPPVRNSDAELILDFLTAEDGTLDSPDDLLLDADPCDLEQPTVLEPVLAPDGHQLSLSELADVTGSATLKCDAQGTRVTTHLSGLVPNGVYTIWLLTFEAPGFTPDFAHLIGEGALGSADGSQNSFVASPSGRASLSARQVAGPLSEFGEVTGCLFDEFEFHLVGAYHPDGLTYGATPGPADAPNPFCYFVEHFGFVFQTASPEACGSESSPSCFAHVEGQTCQAGLYSGVCTNAPDCICSTAESAPTSRYDRGRCSPRCYRYRGLCICPRGLEPDVESAPTAPYGRGRCPRGCDKYRGTCICSGRGFDLQPSPDDVAGGGRDVVWCGSASAWSCLGLTAGDTCGQHGKCRIIDGSIDTCDCREPPGPSGRGPGPGRGPR